MNRNTKHPEYKSKSQADALDQETINIDNLYEQTCSVCGMVVHSEKVVTDCGEADCPFDSVDVFYMDELQELDFND